MIIPQTFSLDLMPQGAFERMARRSVDRIALTAASSGVQEGAFTLGGKRYRIELIERLDETPLLGLDRNLDGRIEGSERLPMVSEQMVEQDGKPLMFYVAHRPVRSPYGDGREVGLVFNYAPKFGGPQVFVDYARRGTLALGGHRYRVELRDHLHRGDFTAPAKEDRLGILLRVDLNENGRFDSRGEEFVVGRPFRVKGQTYEARVLRPDGSRIEIVPSNVDVAEVPPPYVPRRGQAVPSFTTTALDGRSVRFPEDFRGKKVLLEFFGRWSSASEEAAPALADLHRAMAPKGLEMVSVGIDYADLSAKVAEFAKEKGMDWPVLFEKEGWKGAIAQAFSVNRAPSRFLVDGATGGLLATPEELTNERLGETLARILRAEPPASVRKLAMIDIPKDVKDKALYREVMRRVRLDQGVRQHSMSGGDPDGLFEWWEAVDADDLKWLKSLLSRRGWPGHSVLGVEGAHNVWLMVQHTDKDRAFQRYALGLLEKAVKAGDASGRDLAYLTDRVRVGANQPQVYGTQLTSNGGWLRPSPIEDETHVNQRRAAVGLESLEEYVKKAGETMRIPTTPPKG
jgi:peroxiredoxin